MASPDTPGKRCSCREGRAGTSHRKSTEPSVHTVRSMMREGPMMMMAAMMVITRPKKKNKLRQLLHDNGGTKSANAKYLSTAAIPRHQGCYRTGLLHRPSIRHSSRKRLCRAYRKVGTQCERFSHIRKLRIVARTRRICTGKARDDARGSSEKDEVSKVVIRHIMFEHIIWADHTRFSALRIKSFKCRIVKCYNKLTTYGSDKQIKWLQLEHAKVSSTKHDPPRHARRLARCPETLSY